MFFGDPGISAAQLSPDAEYVAYLKSWSGVQNVWVLRLSATFPHARLLTRDTQRPVIDFIWTRDSKNIAFIQDCHGDENFNAYVIRVDDAAGVETPPVPRELTSAPGCRVMLYHLSRSDPDTAYIGLNERDKAWHDLYRLRLSTGERTLLRANTDNISGWIFDLSDNARLATRVNADGGQEILVCDGGGLHRVFECTVFESCRVLRFHRDQKRVYIATNRGDLTDLDAFKLLNVETGAVEPVESDPVNRVDCESALFSEEDDDLLVTTYRDDSTRNYFWNESVRREFDVLAGRLPGYDLSIRSQSFDGERWLVEAVSGTEPGEIHLWHRRTQNISLLFKRWDAVPREQLLPMVPIRYESSGVVITGYLIAPRHDSGGGLPAIVCPHGGPWAREFREYHAAGQFLANRGYAVLLPNYRGSAGFGKRVLNSGNGEWGRKMQDDLTEGVKYLVNIGIADPARVGIMGTSYGGYAALAGLAFTPGVYRAGVAIGAPTHLPTLLDAIPPYWTAKRKQLYTRIGDPCSPEGRSRLEERSPANYVDCISAPVMIVQGATDPRVSLSQADRIVNALRNKGVEVTYLLLTDEGHGLSDMLNNMAVFRAVEIFFARHLRGTSQEHSPAGVDDRLRQVTN